MPYSGYLISPPTTIFCAGSSVYDFYAFDTSLETFAELPDMPVGHTQAVCGIGIHPTDGPEFVIAGNIDEIDVYNFNSGTWGRYGLLVRSPAGAAYTQYGDTFLFMGGSVTDNAVYEYDPESRSFFQRSETVTGDGGEDPFALVIDGTTLNCL